MPDRFGGIILGIALTMLGTKILLHENPTVGWHAGLVVPVMRWIGWPCLTLGLYCILITIYGLYIDKKKERLRSEKASQPSQEPPQA